MSTSTNTKNGTLRMVIIGALVVGAFFGAFRIASAVNDDSVRAAGNGAAAVKSDPTAGASADSGTPACACCGTGQPTVDGVSGDKVEGQAAVTGNVQTLAVDLSTGTYSPNVIKLKAGVPAEITFGQSSGCTGVVQSQDLGFQEDLSAGPATVKLAALEAGTYSFSCGMEMVYGKIVVE